MHKLKKDYLITSTSIKNTGNIIIVCLFRYTKKKLAELQFTELGKMLSFYIKIELLTI